MKQSYDGIVEEEITPTVHKFHPDYYDQNDTFDSQEDDKILNQTFE